MTVLANAAVDHRFPVLPGAVALTSQMKIPLRVPGVEIVKSVVELLDNDRDAAVSLVTSHCLRAEDVA